MPESTINDLLIRCEQHLRRLREERRLTTDALLAFRTLADAVERRVGSADRRHRPRPDAPERRVVADPRLEISWSENE